MRLTGISDFAARAVRTSGTETNEKVSAPTASTAVRREDGVDVSTVFATPERTPPFDGDRVSEIRKAIAEDRYPLVPTKIADALIAAKLYGIVGS